MDAHEDININMHEDEDMNIHDSTAAVSNNEVENDVVEPPPRKKYKNSFKQSASDRRLYDRRNVKSLDIKLNEWYDLTKCPTVALTLIGDQIQYSGPKQFMNFAVNENVKRVFTSTVLNQSKAMENDFSRIQLPSDWRDFDVFSKRKLVIALVTNNGTKRPYWRERTRPIWWPETIPFGDPNNTKPRLSCEQLHQIIAGYSSYMVSNNVIKDDVCVCDDDNGAEQGVDGEDGLRTDDNDSVTESGVCGNNNAGAVYDSYDDGVRVTAGGVDNIGKGDVDNVGIVSDGSVNSGGGDDDETGGGVDDRNSVGSNSGIGGSGDIGREAYSSTRYDTVTGMKDVLRRCTIHDEEHQRQILGFLKGVQTWPEFVGCMKEVKDTVPLTPLHKRAIEDQEYTQIWNVEKSLRCNVPRPVLKDGWEPGRITGDGNCFFRTISKVITGCEDNHLLYKLILLDHACSNLDLFLHTITEDDILENVDHSLSEEDQFLQVFREEVMRTVVDGRYSGYLQVLIMADALQRRIIQHCTSPGMELYNTEVVPLNIPPNVTPIHILWCSLSGDKRNHIVPLQKCREGNEFNSFSKSFDGVCAAANFCQYKRDLESGKESRWVACDRCLLWFHQHCVFFRIRKLGKSWCCGCSTPDDEISRSQINLSPDGMKSFCKDRLQLFVQDLIKGKIKSRRLDFLKCGSPNSLRRGGGLLMAENDDTTDVLMESLDHLLKANDYWPDAVKRSRDNIIHFKLDVLMPEITIYMMSSTSNVSRNRGEEVYYALSP